MRRSCAISQSGRNTRVDCTGHRRASTEPASPGTPRLQQLRGWSGTGPGTSMAGAEARTVRTDLSTRAFLDAGWKYVAVLRRPRNAPASCPTTVTCSWRTRPRGTNGARLTWYYPALQNWSHGRPIRPWSDTSGCCGGRRWRPSSRAGWKGGGRSAPYYGFGELTGLALPGALRQNNWPREG